MSRWFAVACSVVLAACEDATVVSDPYAALPDPDVSRMLRFREAQLKEIEISPTAEELRAYLLTPDRRGQGQALRERASVFDQGARWLQARFPVVTTDEALRAVINDAAAQLPTPRAFTLDEIAPFVRRTGEAVFVDFGRSVSTSAGALEWEWTLFDLRALPAAVLPSLLPLRDRAIAVELSEAFVEENGGDLGRRPEAWRSSSPREVFDGTLELDAVPAQERLARLLPPFAAETLNRWPALPSINCMQAANLVLYPQLNRYPLFYFDPVLFLGDVGQTPWKGEMEQAGAGDQVDEVNSLIEWVHDQVGARGDVDLYELGAPLQTGTVVVFGTVAFHGFIHLGHAVTIVGAVVEGEGEALRVTDYLVLEKENPGLLPIRLERWSRVLQRLEAGGGAYGPGGGIRLFAHTPEGDPLPFAPVDPSLLHPDA